MKMIPISKQSKSSQRKFMRQSAAHGTESRRSRALSRAGGLMTETALARRSPG